MLCLVSVVEQGLCLGADLTGVGAEHEVPNLPAQPGVSRFTGGENVMAALLQRGAQQIDLGGLAGPVTTFEDDEQTSGGASTAPSLLAAIGIAARDATGIGVLVRGDHAFTTLRSLDRSLGQSSANPARSRRCTTSLRSVSRPAS